MKKCSLMVPFIVLIVNAAVFFVLGIAGTLEETSILRTLNVIIAMNSLSFLFLLHILPKDKNIKAKMIIVFIVSDFLFIQFAVRCAIHWIG
jgi:hypothetical protein